MKNNPDIIKQKIIPISEIKTKVDFWKSNQESIVFTNGCFDIIHLGHIDYLSKAADLGSKLVLGLNSDFSVRSIKGDHRPIIDETSRAYVLAALFFIDAVVLFDNETPYELIKTIVPDILVKGNDYQPNEIIGYDIVNDNGGEIITVPLVDGYSTSKIEKKIKNNIM